MVKISKDYNGGQVFLIILLIMVVGLTISLALINRSITDIKMSRQADEASRAFSAAEAGIEVALQNITVAPTYFNLPSDITVGVTPSEIGGGDKPFYFPGVVHAGEIETLWLVPHLPNGDLDKDNPYGYDKQIDVCWGKEGPNNDLAAMEIALIYQDNPTDTDYRMGKVIYRILGDLSCGDFIEIDDPQNCGDAVKYPYGQRIDLLDLQDTTPPNTVIALRMRPLCDNVVLAVNPVDDSLPKQGYRFISIAQTAGRETAKVEAYKSYPAPAGIFDSVIFSGDDLGH